MLFYLDAYVFLYFAKLLNGLFKRIPIRPNMIVSSIVCNTSRGNSFSMRRIIGSEEHTALCSFGNIRRMLHWK